MSIHPPAPSAIRPAAGLFYGCIGMVIFGGTLPATRLALESFDPVFTMFARAVIAAMAAGVAIVVLRRKPPFREWRIYLLVAATLVFGFPLFVNLAMVTVPAAHGGVVLGVLPLLTAAFAMIFDGERPGPAFWGWSLLGAALVLAFTLGGSQLQPGIGHFWLLCAAATSALGYVFSARLSRRRPGWEVIGWALVLSLPLTLAGTVSTWKGWTAPPPNPEAIAGLAYLGLGSMFAGFIFWNHGLALGGIARVGQVQLFQTFVTLGIAALVLGEAVTPAMSGFAGAVVFTVWMASRVRIGQTDIRG